jgi:hypothetical protein
MHELNNAWSMNLKLNNQQWSEFYILFREVQLLFLTKVLVKFDCVLVRMFRVQQHYKSSEDYRSRGDDLKGDMRQDSAMDEEEKVMKIMPDLLNDLIDYTRIDAWE